MGICSSCLGLGRRDPNSEVSYPATKAHSLDLSLTYDLFKHPETSRLLSDDPYRPQYGSNNANGQRSTYQPDPESLRREREALEGICNAMSDNVIDVFTVLPQATSQRKENHNHPNSTKDHAARLDSNELTPEELKYKTIKRGKVGPVVSTLGKGNSGWKEFREAIG
ncbi:hypothetical protein MMC20_000832 [Loxospora ochrophaea]|nr:hypothetical protein [Loxospora ochrophaea]